MENKINIAELLKDCPKGMELDCTIYDTKVFYQGLNKRILTHPITVQTEHGFEFELTQYGQIHNIVGSKCVIFPKGKTTWEGFHRPFEDGDIIVDTLGGIHIMQNSTTSYCYFDRLGILDKTKTTCVRVERSATEEEKRKLFDAIKANGYRWNAETKTLENLSKFKVGDIIRHKSNNEIYCKLGEYSEDLSAYYTNVGFLLTLKDLEQWELRPNKFDVTTLKPFDKVLVRGDDNKLWKIQFFERLNNVLKDTFVCMGGYRYHQCVPYEGNEHLLNTSNKPDDSYKTWKNEATR